MHCMTNSTVSGRYKAAYRRVKHGAPAGYEPKQPRQRTPKPALA